MALTLFVGGVRSGKSKMAQVQAECEDACRLMIAVCHANDKEMAARIAAHKRARGDGWETLEEPLDPLAALEIYRNTHPRFQGPIVLDSLGMYINNLMMLNLPQSVILRRCQALALAFSRSEHSCSIVSEECGMGIVPTAAVARKFGDILGRANEIAARHAERVIFAVCGVPMPIK